ncbi:MULTISPECIES: carbohydrate ABC transporter permease [Paenibacillus]|uniref:carbohydrate ABC transporter permease n=1 Tax=Paenibacillus TaxID=44249 RepID=UPI000BBDC2E2|nr:MULTISPECIES: carbohydrate ABC transporter permease [Paenibacillus]MCM3261682.1 carbohydrate ABC transporter permease [Paenibacillus lautus]PCL89666.1 sugar ABC transporter permease [Paenibacillus lautus]QOT08714.1 carbohydrate ABC transporter permease [Paenibacillus sp. JNUCC-32]WFB59345.1 carbohydrate ABC transporter permease [Paenibacillus sp. BR1-192]GIP06073.1 sugar ABC transporter permease [Paenibacillus lautus]
MSKPSTVKEASSERLFDILIYAIAAIIIVIVLYPLLFIVSASFSDPARVLNGEVWLLPKGVTLDAYENILHNDKIWTGYRNTILYTTVGTAINIIMTILAAYPLSRPDLPGRNGIMVLITLTMFFNGGLIPTYLLVKDLGMVDTMWALIIPGAIATYNLIVMRTYFQSSIPWELQEAAHIDGCSNWRLLFSIILPLSKPILAVMVLFYAVGHWNSFFNALIYIRNEDLHPLQLVLREILLISQSDAVDGSVGLEKSILLAESIKYAVIIVSSLPVLLMYPLVQRHFVKGVMIGSIKG